MPASCHAPSRGSVTGFTLVELMVTIAVLAILVLIAAPSFSEFRERNVVRGAADEVVNQIANYRFEAIRRNRPVTIGVGGSGAGWCVGAALGASTSACDCMEDAACTVGRFPGGEGGALRGTRLVDSASFDAFAFDPSTGTPTALDVERSLVIGSPTESYNYALQVSVNAMGRAQVCVPADRRAIAGVPSC